MKGLPPGLANQTLAFRRHRARGRERVNARSSEELSEEQGTLPPRRHDCVEADSAKHQRQKISLKNVPLG